jgi:hypothetical protein
MNRISNHSRVSDAVSRPRPDSPTQSRRSSSRRLRLFPAFPGRTGSGVRQKYGIGVQSFNDCARRVVSDSSLAPGWPAWMPVAPERMEPCR